MSSLFFHKIFADYTAHVRNDVNDARRFVGGACPDRIIQRYKPSPEGLNVVSLSRRRLREEFGVSSKEMQDYILRMKIARMTLELGYHESILDRCRKNLIERYVDSRDILTDGIAAAIKSGLLLISTFGIAGLTMNKDSRSLTLFGCGMFAVIYGFASAFYAIDRKKLKREFEDARKELKEALNQLNQLKIEIRNIKLYF